MFSIYDQVSSIKLPNGKIKSAEELKNDTQYELLFNNICAIDTNQNGVVTTFMTVDDLKNTFKVNETDAVNIVNKVNEIIANNEAIEEEAQEQNRIDIENHNILIEENTEAIGELGSITSESDADILEAVAELGVMVASMQSTES